MSSGAGRARRERTAGGLALALLGLSLVVAGGRGLAAGDWPRWRGPGGRAVAEGDRLPLRWSTSTNVVWSVAVPGEGTSSPIVSGDRVYVTSAEEEGTTRLVHSVAAADGSLLWTGRIDDEAPELASSVTGHAAPTPASDGKRVVAFFGNAGVVCFDANGAFLWRRRFGEFDSELGIASSPILDGGRVILVCDHDGDRFSSFDSFITALDATSGETIWRTDRPDLYRSWSTPILVPVGDDRELVVCAQDEVRGYDPERGVLLWRIDRLTGWVTPSPVFADGRVVVTSGKEGPVLAARPGGRGDVTASHVLWKREREGAYVTSPVVYDGRVWVIRQTGVVSCYRLADGERIYRDRLDGKFTASPIAGAGHVYFVAESGTTCVVRAADSFEVVARNELGEYSVASPAAADGRLFLRTERRLYSIGQGDREGDEGEGDPESPRREAIHRAVAYLERAALEWPRTNGCFSCHNNGDAARALFAARRESHDISATSWKATAEWLRTPEEWTRQKGADDYADPDLARVQFASALLGATEAGLVDDRGALARAAELLIEQQQEDGSWNGGSRNPVGSPTAWSRHLATHLAHAFLAAATPDAHSGAVRRADAWLAGKEPRNVHDAAIRLLGGAKEDDPHVARALEILRAGRHDGGGWGPFTNAAPEVFDTALVVLALGRYEATAARDEIAAWIRGGRKYLVAAQEPDGGWLETTRPPGAESYAQRVSTSAWAVLALLAAE